MVNDYSFLTKSQSTPNATSGVDYSFLTRTTAPKETPKAPENVIKASDYKTVRLPLSLGGGEYITDKNGNLYLSERSQETLGGTLPGMERDHIVPVSLGGTSNKENLQYLESKPSFWQRIGGIFGKETSVQKSPNRQEGKLKVEQEAISGFQSGDLSVGEARLMVAMENMRIQGLSPSQKEMSVAGNLGKGIKDAFKTVLAEPSVDLVKKMGQTIIGSLDFLHRTGLQVVSGVGTVVSPTIVSLSKFVGDDQLKNISYDEIWKEELEKGTKRMLDIGRPDEFFRAKINNDNYVPMMLFNDEIQSLAKSSNEKMDKGDVKGSVGDMFKIMGVKAMTDWANPFYAFAIKGIRFDPTKARGKVLWQGTFKQPVNQIGKAKEVQGVLRLEAQPQKIVEVIKGRVKTLKEPDIRIWMKTTKDGKISVDMRNVGGDILNKDLLKAVGETTTQPGVTPIMSLPVKLRPSTVKPIKPVITPATVKAPTPELQPLKKDTTNPLNFKTAEDYVKAQGTPVYHGGAGIKGEISPTHTTELQKKAGTVHYKKGFSISSSKNVAKRYGSKVEEIYISPDAKIATPKDLPEVKFTKFSDGEVAYNQADAVKFSKEKGFDGVDLNAFEKLTTNPSANLETQIFNTDIIKTKSQLISEWNKANKVEPLVEDPKNFKTAEDYVKAHSLYHGTPNELVGGKLTFGAGNQLKKGGYMGGHFLTDTPEIAQNFSFGGKVYQASGEIKNKVLDVNNNKKLFQDYIGKEYLSDGEKVKFTKQDFDYMFPDGKADWSTINTDLLEQLAKKQGKIGVSIPEYAGGKQGMTYQIFEDNIPVYTKSQLTDIWNKAHVKSNPLIQEVKKYKTTINIQDKNDLEYLSRILSEDNIKDIKAGKMTNFRGKPYEDLARVNIISETPKTVEQQLVGKIKDVKLKTDTFYHGTSAENARGIMRSGFKRGSELPEETFRGGGYGKMQSSISLTETPKDASRFSTLTKNGEIVEAKLKPNSKVVSIEGVEDAVELEDYISYLKKQKVDAVYIGGGEKELVVINPKAITPTKSQLTDIWNRAQKSTPTKPSIEPSFSRHYERIKEQYGFKDGVEFDRKTELVEKKKAFDFIQRSPEKALRIGYGYDEVPKGINQQVFRASLVASLNAQGKTVLAQQVAKIQSSKMTEAAQTLAFGRLDIGTEAGIIKNITQARLEKIGKGLGVKEPEKRVEQARQVIERQAKDASKKVSELQKGKNTAKQLKEIDDLISSIIC